MEVLTIIDVLKDNIQNTTLLEVVAVVFGLMSVWFAKQEKILVYPTGIINVLIYVYICFFAKLYADMGINAFYFIMSIYGWYNWSRTDANNNKTPISRNTLRQNFYHIIATVVFFFILFFVLTNFTDSDVPFWDSVTTAIFIIGMWLMALKKIENWIAWIIGNAISIPLYAYKGLVLTSFQYSVFLALAIAGYISWNRTLKQKT